MKRSIFSIGIFLVGCAAEPIAVTPVALSPEQTSAITDGVKRALKDPESAQLANLRAARSDKTGTIRVCGTVNAKNSYGGYNGHMPFFGHLVVNDPPIFQVAQIASPQKNSDILINAQCRYAGL